MKPETAVWPYPHWIAHRGAGKLAPENTLAAFECGVQHGYRMFECDVKLSADGVPFLLHDDHLLRTTNAAQSGKKEHANQYDWAELAMLDAGAWFAEKYAGERLPTLARVAAYCMNQNVFLNIELKPAPGDDVRTGHVVAREAVGLWSGSPRSALPLITSFSRDALAAALSVHRFTAGLLLERWDDSALTWAIAHGCSALVCHYPLWNQKTVTQARLAGLKTLAYTVNDDADVQRLLALGMDGIITDRVDFFVPDLSA